MDVNEDQVLTMLKTIELQKKIIDTQNNAIHRQSNTIALIQIAVGAVVKMINSDVSKIEIIDYLQRIEKGADNDTQRKSN